MNTQQEYEETEGQDIEEQKGFTVTQKSAYVVSILLVSTILLSSLLCQCHNERVQEIQAQQAHHTQQQK